MGINSRFECPHSGQVIVEYSSIERNREDFPKNVTVHNGPCADLQDTRKSAFERPELGAQQPFVIGLL